MIGLTVARLWSTAIVCSRGRIERCLPLFPRPWIERLQRQRLRTIIGQAPRTVRFYRDAMQHACLRPSDDQTADDLARLPPQR